MRKEIIDLLKTEVKPAMGCTEPVAITLAAAVARDAIDLKVEDIKQVEVSLSPNLFKNGLGVGIPHSDEVGLDVAAAIGLVCGDPDLGLRIFESVDAASVEVSKDLIKNGLIKIGIEDTSSKVFISVDITTSKDHVLAIIEGMHNHIRLISVNGKITVDVPYIAAASSDKFSIQKLSLDEIIDEVEGSSLEELEFLYEGYVMNGDIAAEGLKNKLGMGVGYTIKQNIDKGLLGKDLASSAMYYTAAASDARMSGITMPVMSSNGSGNNGLTAILPIYAYAQLNVVDKEELCKALALSHLLNCYIKSFIGRLSAICSCGISAAIGSGTAISWLMTKDRVVMNGTINNMIGNLSGMICDGAKNGCALKLATAASTAVHSSFLAASDSVVNAKTGIVGTCAEESIKNLGVLSDRGMTITDSVILDIMSSSL